MLTIVVLYVLQSEVLLCFVVLFFFFCFCFFLSLSQSTTACATLSSLPLVCTFIVRLSSAQRTMAYEKTCSKGEWDYRDNDNIFGGGSTHWPPLSLSPNEAGEDSNAQIRPGDDLRGCLRETLSESWQIKAIQFEPSPCSYLHIAKPSALEPRNEMSFMEWYPKGGASISFQGDDGHIDTIDGINVFLIESRCQLLATAFEHSKSGPQLFLAALSSSTAIPFVRYLYTGSYALQKVDGDVFDDVPTSVLLHCQLFRLGVLYDLSELKTQAYVNVLRQCEFGCSSPSKPIDLCVAIRYMYQHLREQEQLIDAVVQYCVSCFFHHRLDVDPEFCKLAYELRPLHQDMCRILRDRDFEDDSRPTAPASDLVYH